MSLEKKTCCNICIYHGNEWASTGVSGCCKKDCACHAPSEDKPINQCDMCGGTKKIVKLSGNRVDIYDPKEVPCPACTKDRYVENIEHWENGEPCKRATCKICHPVAEEKRVCSNCGVDFTGTKLRKCPSCKDPIVSSPISESCVKEDIDILRKVGGKLKLPQIKNIQSLLTLTRTETVQSAIEILDKEKKRQLLLIDKAGSQKAYHEYALGVLEILTPSLKDLLNK